MRRKCLLFKSPSLPGTSPPRDNAVFATAEDAATADFKQLKATMLNLPENNNCDLWSCHGWNSEIVHEINRILRTKRQTHAVDDAQQ